MGISFNGRMVGLHPTDGGSTPPISTLLTRGVMVAQEILILLVGVRVPAGQPLWGLTSERPYSIVGIQ